jgi:hypothetical protein
VTAQPGKEFFSLPNLLNKGLRYANGWWPQSPQWHSKAKLLGHGSREREREREQKKLDFFCAISTY